MRLKKTRPGTLVRDGAQILQLVSAEFGDGAVVVVRVLPKDGESAPVLLVYRDEAVQRLEHLPWGDTAPLTAVAEPAGEQLALDLEFGPFGERSGDDAMPAGRALPKPSARRRRKTPASSRPGRSRTRSPRLRVIN